METPDFTPASAASPVQASRRAWRPADYYSSPPRTPLVPRGVVIGCGAGALVILLLVFAAGALLSTSAVNNFMDMALGMTMGEVRGMYAKELSADQKKAFESEVETMRGHLRDGRISVRALDPLMQTISAAGKDEKIERAELEQLTTVARKINSGAKRP